MGAKTLALCGLDKAEEERIRAMVAEANEGLRARWSVVAEADAAVLLIDLDSMYGQMTWLRAQSGARPIIALTAASRADSGYLLQRPGSAAVLAELLVMIGKKHPAGAAPAAAASAAATPPSTAAPAPKPVSSAKSEPTPAAVATTETSSRGSKPVDSVATPAPVAAPSAEAEPVVIAEPEAPAEPQRALLFDHLRAAAFESAVLLKDSVPTLVFDQTAKTYLGGATLKPLLPLTAREIASDDWAPVSAADYARLRDELGGEQPLSRLTWLSGLGAGQGALLAEIGMATRFKLSKYPQSEREFPRHFRIATAMLKQLASIDELATASGASAAEVSDFINAGFALGIVEMEGLPSNAPPEPPPRVGLLNRLRGRK